MNLKNEALQELYDTLTYGPILSSPYTESPIDRAFKECDEKISESVTFKLIKDIQNRCDNLERSNKALRDDNDKLGDKVIKLNKKNEQLEKDKKRFKEGCAAKSKENATLISANADLSDRIDKLQRNYDRINSLWTSQIQENMELKSKIADLKREKEELVSQDDEISKLKKDLDDAKNQLAYFTLSRDNWRGRAKHAEDEVEDLKKERDRYSGLYTELKKDYDRLFEENRSLKSKIIDFKKRITELQKKGDDLSKKAVALQEELDRKMASRKHLRQLYVGEGARKLWDMLQNVNDSQPYEFDVKCESMEDVVGMDLDDFLDAYKKWQKEKEQNETDRMRDWLADFCRGRVCAGCPLESNEYKCVCGLSFRKSDRSDDNIIPDKDIKRYYDKASGCGHISSPVEGVNRAISKACDEFRKAILDADNKITENLRKGYTLEATVEVNKDLLATVCGVKPKAEDHQLEYGDAVRVPWQSYDYMYIGPEDKHIRLFDPKTHAVVLVSVTDNLTYQGCKIILCDEDDIRKIWKDKK